jgi:hypothetical protein
MQVEARHHRNVCTDCCAHATEDLAFAIVVLFGHHRAVQIEVDAVHRPGRLKARDYLAHDSLEGIARDVRRRARRRPRRADQPMTERAQRFDRALRGDVGALHRGEDRVAELHAGPAAARLERRVIGKRRRESVGLVLEAADRNACHLENPS